MLSLCALAIWKEALTTGKTHQGYRSAGFVGGPFGPDGIHPSNTVQAIFPNAFLDALNQHSGFHLPLIGCVGLNLIAATNPFVNWNGMVLSQAGLSMVCLRHSYHFSSLSGDAENCFYVGVPANDGP